MSQTSLITVTIYRRNYGYRYTDLPVDRLETSGLTIDCSASFTRPEHYDLRPGDIVRWRAGDRWIEAVISSVTRDPASVRAELSGAHLLPPDFFLY